jgi:voltage-gated potassium channel
MAQPDEFGDQNKGQPQIDASNTMAARATYQIFMVLVTLLALAIVAIYYILPLPDTIREVLYILDSLISTILLFDFFVHLFAARERRRYLIWQAWFDLLGALPGLPALRLARIPGLVVMLRELQGTTPLEARQAARQRLAESTLLIVVLVVLVVVTVGSILIVLVEAPVASANIKNGEDAVWWSIVTVSTVGYGDRFPVTPLGRLIGTAMIVMGVSLFSVLTSYIATQFMARRKTAVQSEHELLRQQLEQTLREWRRSTESENAALRAEVAALRRLLMERAPAQPHE